MVTACRCNGLWWMTAVRSTAVVTEPVQWLTDTEQKVWRQLLTVECRLKERLDQELRTGAGLTLGEYEVLVHLSEAPAGALRMSELASRLLLSRSGLTRRVDGLVQEGLVARQPCGDDGRGAMAVLTPSGLERLEQAAPVHVEGIRRYLIDPVNGSAGPEGFAGLARVLDGIEGMLAQR
jgi:DNA-binding MarR family transcriptional regulator